MTEQQLDDRLTAAAKDAVERFRSLRNQNDGVLVSIIRDCLLREYQHAVAEERASLLAAMRQELAEFREEVADLLTPEPARRDFYGNPK